jgi:hypothetical protein
MSQNAIKFHVAVPLLGGKIDDARPYLSVSSSGERIPPMRGKDAWINEDLVERERLQSKKR